MRNAKVHLTATSVLIGVGIVIYLACLYPVVAMIVCLVGLLGCAAALLYLSAYLISEMIWA